MSITFAVVEDNPTLLKAITVNLSVFEEVTLVCTARNGQDALKKIEHHQPQVVLMDIEMPVMDGISATAEICQRWPAIRVLMLTIFDREDKLFEAIRSGASGYLLKDERPSRIVAAIEEVLSGGAPMSPGIALKTLGLLRRQTLVEPDGEKPMIEITPPTAFSLTTREVDILELIVEGISPGQMADRLFISVGTVRKHVENIYQKLHVHSRLEAIRLAEKNRWF